VASYGFLNGGKGYKPPYPGHEAMCPVIKSEGRKSSSKVGSSKVTEGRKPSLPNKAKGASGAHGSRGYQAAKVQRSK
jgi:hypothetical protein